MMLQLLQLREQSDNLSPEELLDLDRLLEKFQEAVLADPDKWPNRKAVAADINKTRHWVDLATSAGLSEAS